MMPNVQVLRRAPGLMPRPTRAYVMAEHGPCERALLLRQRIGMALAILAAAETQPGLDPRAAAHFARLRAQIAHLPTAWEGAFGRSWEDGRQLHWMDTAQKRGPAARALLAQAYPTDNRRPLDEYPPWQAARATCLAIRADAEREARAEMDRRRQVLREHIARARMEEAIRAARTQRRWEEAQRRQAQAERRRQEQELHQFRTGTQKRVRFPNERRKQRVRSR